MFSRKYKSFKIEYLLYVKVTRLFDNEGCIVEILHNCRINLYRDNKNPTLIISLLLLKKHKKWKNKHIIKRMTNYKTYK